MRRAARPLLFLCTATTVLALAKVHAQYIGYYDLTDSSRFPWTLLFIGILCVAAYAVGLPDAPRDAYEAMWLSAAAGAFAALTVSAGALLVGNPVLPRFVLFWSCLFLVPQWALCSFIAVRGSRREGRRERVLAILDEDVATFEIDLKMAPERRVVVSRTLTVAEARATTEGATPVLDAVAKDRTTLLVLDRAAQADPSVVAQAAEAHEHGVRIRTLSLFYESWLGKLPLSELERVSLLFDIGEVHRSAYVRVKRLFDIVFGVAGVAVLLALLPIVVVGNLLANRGPLFYRQERVGKNGRLFTVLKFRTMRPSTSGLHDEWTAEDDPRITPFGRLLRATHIDELPQIVNVFAGDMAVVGPRPEQPHYVERLSAKIPFYGLRHLVRPGLTGWAQVKYGYAGSEVDALQKLQYEFYYLRHQNLALDARVLVRTLRSVTRLAGR